MRLISIYLFLAKLDFKSVTKDKTTTTTLDAD